MKDFSKTILKTSAAVAVMAAIGAYAYYGEFKKGGEEARKKEEAKKLFNFDKSGVLSIEVTKDGKTVVLLKKDGWRITSPVRADGDSSAIDQLLTALENFRVERMTDGKPADLAPYGLGMPSFRLVAKLAGDTAVGLSIGNLNQFDQTCYVMRDGDPKVYQAGSSTRWGVDKDLFALRDKRIFMGDSSAEIVKLEVRLPDKSYTAVSADGAWSVEVDTGGVVFRDRADDEELTRITNAIRSVRAVGTSADGVTDPAAAGIDPRRGSVAVWRGKEAAREEIFIALAKKSDTPVVHAMRSGSDTVYELGEQFYKDLNKAFFDLRYKKPLSFKRDEVKRIVFAKGDAKAVLVRDPGDAGGDGWFLDEPGRPRAKSQLVGSIIYELEGMKAVEFKGDTPAALKQAGLAGPHKTVELYDGSGGELGRLDIGGAADKGVFVKGTSRPEVLVVEKSKLEQIPSDPSDLRDPEQKPQP